LTERFPPEWVDELLHRGSNFEVLRPDPTENLKPMPSYITDGKRTLRVRSSMLISPFSRARLYDYKVVEKIS